MNSMTGFGRGEATGTGFTLTMEVSSVNRKNLEMHFSLPREWQAMERELVAVARERVARGKLAFSLHVTREGEAGGLRLDEPALLAALDALRSLAARASIPFEPEASTLVRLVQMTSATLTLPPWEDALPAALVALRASLESLAAMRHAEGEALALDLAARLDQMASWVSEVGGHVAGAPVAYRDALLERLAQAGLTLELQDERVLKELALFADRCDVTEEITRLGSHIEQCRTCLRAPEPTGRKLDFLCQEMHREINTIGSKANSLAATRLVIELKNELERIREQVQNIE